MKQTEAVLAARSTDLNGLIERAIFTDKALASLTEALQVLAVELRKQLQAAVDREREIHNRPVIAGIAIGGLALLLLMAFAWRYVRHLAGPIRALEEGATRIGRGDLTSRIDVRTGDELQSLAEHFNQMAGQLQESYANLEGKVEERTQQLARSVSELEALGEVSRDDQLDASSCGRCSGDPGARLRSSPTPAAARSTSYDAGRARCFDLEADPRHGRRS